eukprot:Nitzschia sp. Nitz4//scaffold159_size51929//33708//36626//NITZ4_006882-RA/size51929-snap-gene-0.62-mRNA-1//-1//CDS//3329537583//6108//frame0
MKSRLQCILYVIVFYLEYSSLVQVHAFHFPSLHLYKSLDRKIPIHNHDALVAPSLRESFKHQPLWASKDTSQESSNDFLDQDLQEANALASQKGQIDLPDEIKRSFLQYAMSIILGRALPDARDGLKPVHRRILYSMHQLNLSPTASHRKCARVVGEVLGKFHPHGDVAVYDALVRMAQPFSSYYRLVDGHGNFGSIDADPPAAMRYTECRLTPLATQAMLRDIGDDTVDFSANFDGNEMEPTVLPVQLPMILLNGCSGIAVGMATNVPPHNLREILSACTALVKTRVDNLQGGSKIFSDDELFDLVPGPDFPTGASIMGADGARKLYETGQGGVTLRAVADIETIAKGKTATRTAIVVKELPYQVNKAALLEKIATLVNDKQLEGIADLRDESDRDGIRVVLELKRDAVPDFVLNTLYSKTSLQTTFSGNFLALMKDDTNTAVLTPKRFTLRAALDYFLDFRLETIRRKSAHQLAKVSTRAHVVEGLLRSLARVDDVIDWIRNAADLAAVRIKLMDQNYLGLSKEQADAVLKLQLGQLTRLNSDKLQEEKSTLDEESKTLKKLLNQEEAVYDVMLGEFRELDARFGHDRKTQILNEEGTFDELDLIKNARSVVVVTRGGYVKRMPLATFESQARGTQGKMGTASSTNDEEVAQVITCNDHDTLLMISQNGIAHTLRAYQIPSGGRTARGTPLSTILPISLDDVVSAVLPVSKFHPDEYVVLVTEQGMIKKTPLDAFEKISKRGLTIAKLRAGDKLRWCHKCRDDDEILMASSKGYAIRYHAEKVRPTGRGSQGIIAMKLHAGDTIAGMNVLKSGTAAKKYVLCVTTMGYGKRTSADDFKSSGRLRSGVLATKFKAEEDHLQSFCVVEEDDEVLINTSKGRMVRQKVSQISCLKRRSSGVIVQKLTEGDQVAQVSVVPRQ